MQIYQIEIPIDSGLKTIYFTVITIKIKNTKFLDLSYDEKLNAVLKNINDQRENFDGFIQLFSISECIGVDHIKYAIYHALKNIYRKCMISNLPENELLLYLTIQRQISKAFSSMGIKNDDFKGDTFEKELIIISPNRDSIDLKINQMKKSYILESVSIRSIEESNKIFALAKKYGIYLNENNFSNAQSLYAYAVARLNEKMIKLTIDNVF